MNLLRPSFFSYILTLSHVSNFEVNSLIFLRQGLSRVVTTGCFTLQTHVVKEASLHWP